MPVHVCRMAVFLLLLAVTLQATLSPVDSAQGTPPKLLENVQTKFRIPVGTTQFKFNCPVIATEKGSLLMIQWSKNGENIEWDSRYKPAKNDRELRMRNVKLEDSGIYECQATNGFGHRSVQFSLHVYNTDSDGVSLRDSIIETNETSSPEWMSNTDMESSAAMPIKISLGGKMELRCPAKGKPLPEIRWYKDNILIERDNIEPYSAVLIIDSVKETDTADYRCVVENNIGSIENVYRVRVSHRHDDVDNREDGPVIDQPFNTSVKEGHTAQLQCKARAHSSPLIKWLKEIEDPITARRRDPNATIVNANGMHLLVLDQPQVESVTRGDGENMYSNRLIIPYVRTEHAGKYICVVTSSQGHIVYRTAQLDVIEDAEARMNTFGFTSDIFWYITGIAAVFVFLVIVAVLYLKCSSEDGTTKPIGNKPPPPPRIPPPMAPSQASDTIYPQSGYPCDTHYVVEKSANTLILQDHMFQHHNFPMGAATLDKKHMPRMMRGSRENENQNFYDCSSPQPYWSQTAQKQHPIYAPPSGNYRTLEVGFPYRHPNNSIYDTDSYAEQGQPFISYTNR